MTRTKAYLQESVIKYCCLIYVFIVPSYMPGEAAFSQYGIGTLTSCFLAFFLHSQSAHLLKFTSFLHELSQPWNLQKTTPTKAATVKKKKKASLWWFRDLDLLRKMTEQSQKHQRDKTEDSVFNCQGRERDQLQQHQAFKSR